MADDEDDGPREPIVVTGKDIKSFSVSDVVQPALASKQDAPLTRETTAHFLGRGIFWVFALMLVFLCVAHVLGLWIIMTPPPADVKPDALEAWFRWREQLAESVRSFAQTVGTLLAGPLGVVLGFYFRDRG